MAITSVRLIDTELKFGVLAVVLSIIVRIMIFSVPNHSFSGKVGMRAVIFCLGKAVSDGSYSAVSHSGLITS